MQEITMTSSNGNIFHVNTLATSRLHPQSHPTEEDRHPIPPALHNTSDQAKNQEETADLPESQEEEQAEGLGLLQKPKARNQAGPGRGLQQLHQEHAEHGWGQARYDETLLSIHQIPAPRLLWRFHTTSQWTCGCHIRREGQHVQQAVSLGLHATERPLESTAQARRSHSPPHVWHPHHRTWNREAPPKSQPQQGNRSISPSIFGQSQWYPISLVRHLIGPPSHWSPN